MELYTVKQGDTVDLIAASYRIPVEALIWANQIEYPYRLAVGQSLLITEYPAKCTGDAFCRIAGQEEAASAAEKRLLYSFGYAYPFIDPDVLADTLPFLTDLYVFSYGFTEEGDLIPPAVDDGWMIAAAKTAGVRPVLTLTPLGADGRFNSYLVTILVHQADVRQRLIWELGRTMQEKGFLGLNIDFEYVEAGDRVGFAAFVAQVQRVMSVFDYEVSVALAPKTSASQRGVLYEGIDYRLLGEAADRVFLMTYEWGYTYGPPMAVAPLNMVRRVAEYGVSEIPAEKISLGIPNYGYDWPLPYERGTTKAMTIHNREAVQIAIDHGVDIRFDERSASPFFRYWQYGIQHEVWFEDARSILGKFRLIQEFGFSGAGYWQLMSFFRANWLMMEELFQIEKKLTIK